MALAVRRGPGRKVFCVPDGFLGKGVRPGVPGGGGQGRAGAVVVHPLGAFGA